jgi:hypothetical protein
MVIAHEHLHHYSNYSDQSEGSKRQCQAELWEPEERNVATRHVMQRGQPRVVHQQFIANLEGWPMPGNLQQAQLYSLASR